MSAPANEIVPKSGTRNPEIRLNKVVLPAPLGPINAVIRLSRAASQTSVTAERPPNRLLTCLTSSMLRFRRACAPETGAKPHQAIGEEAQHDDQQCAVKRH